MEIYVVIHILVFLSLIFEVNSSLKAKRNVIIVWCLFFTLFGGLRWTTGNDWDQYYRHFINSEWSNVFNYDRYGNGSELLEPGFVFLNVLVKTIFGKYYAFNLLAIGFIQFTYYKFSNFVYPNRPLVVYALLMNMVPNYFAVRAGICFGLVCWVYIYMIKRNLKMYLLVLGMAIMIHNQSIALLPLYWLHKIKFNFKIATILYFSVALLSLKYQEYFKLLCMLSGGNIAEKAVGYTEWQTDGVNDNGIGILGIGLNYFFLCIYYYIRKQLRLFNSNWYTICINAFLIYISIFMVFSGAMGDLSRLSLMFFPGQVILYMFAIMYFNNEKTFIDRGFLNYDVYYGLRKIQVSKIYGIMAFTFYILYYLYKIKGNWSGVFFEDTCLPYQTIFDVNIY